MSDAYSREEFERDMKGETGDRLAAEWEARRQQETTVRTAAADTALRTGAREGKPVEVIIERDGVAVILVEGALFGAKIRSGAWAGPASASTELVADASERLAALLYDERAAHDETKQALAETRDRASAMHRRAQAAEAKTGRALVDLDTERTVHQSCHESRLMWQDRAETAEQKLAQLREERDGCATCPCVLVEPCSSQCTCANSTRSGGCRRCASYGSNEQRIASAQEVVRRESQRDALIAFVRNLVDSGPLRASRSADWSGENWRQLALALLEGAKS